MGKPAGSLDYLGRLPTASKVSPWREIKGYKNYFVIGSEAEGHGIQIFNAEKVYNTPHRRVRVGMAN